VNAVDKRTDVYALGAILFELLTLEPLHERIAVSAMLAATLKSVEARPSARVPDAEVPPELEAICVRATALDPHERFQSVREISDAIERYLDGDRDLERRRSLAREHADAATRALASDASEADKRREAMQGLGRALALDAGNADAMRTLVKLVSEPPERIPPEAREMILHSREDAQRVGARAAGMAYLSWFLYFPFVLWMGIRNWTIGCIVGGLWAASGIASLIVSRRKIRRGAIPWFTMVLSSIAVMGASSFFGPLVLVPSLAAVNALSFVAATDRPRRIGATLMGALTILIPFVLEMVGVLPRSYAFENGHLVVLPHVLSFTPMPTLVFLLFANVAVVVTACLFLLRFSEAVDRTEERLHVQAWHLRQLMPEEARGVIPSTPPPGSLSDAMGCAVASGGAWTWAHRRARRA
jgi:serine/threonine-protein kinase